MPTAIGERAIADAVRIGNAILKFISANDVGQTGGHQCGYYLPKPVWEMFTEHPPQRGRNDETEVEVQWQDGRVTQSRVKWYGAAKSEYRLTRFGRDFPFLTHDNVGDLLVLIPVDLTHFIAYVLDLEEDIEDIQAALGVEISVSWAAYRNGQPQVPPEDEEECIERRFRRFSEALRAFPTGEAFSAEARATLEECIRAFARMSAGRRANSLHGRRVSAVPNGGASDQRTGDHAAVPRRGRLPRNRFGNNEQKEGASRALA